MHRTFPPESLKFCSTADDHLFVQAALKQLVDGFGESPLLKGKLMRELLEADREAFRAASISLLKSATDERGCRYLITLLWTHDLLIQSLCDDRAMPLDQAIAAARAAARVDPQLHIRLLRHLLSSLDAGSEATEVPGAGRLLEILSSITEKGNVLPLLTQLLRHPNGRIRSKAALLIGRGNRSIKWLGKRMAEQDPRVRANAIEALWGVDGEGNREILWEAVKDSHNRVAGNALVGLYRTGEASSIPAFLQMVENADPLFQLTGAWAMGEIEDPRFLPLLGRMLTGAQGSLRKTVFHAINRIKKGRENGAAKPPLRVTMLQVQRAGDQTKMRVAVSDSEGSLTQLPPTAFIVWMEGTPVARYSVEEHSQSDPLAIAFLHPVTVEKTKAFATLCAESLLTRLEAKRKGDIWCVLRYAEHLDVDAGLSGASERIFGQDLSKITPPVAGPAPEVNLTANPVQIRNRIEAMGNRYDTPPGIVEAIERIFSSMTSQRGSRHLIVFQDCGQFEPDRVREFLSSAKTARVGIHAISLASDPALRDLCLETGGTFQLLEDPALIAAALETLYSSLLCRYDVQFTSEAGSAIRLQIASAHGNGEALASIG